MKDSINILFLGKNTVVVESSSGPVFRYMYMRTIKGHPEYSSATQTTFSNDLEYLKKLSLNEANMTFGDTDPITDVEALHKKSLEEYFVSVKRI